MEEKRKKKEITVVHNISILTTNFLLFYLFFVLFCSFRPQKLLP